VHQPAQPIDVVLATAQSDFGHRALRSIDKIRIERLRKPSPEASLRRARPCTGRFIDRNDAHRVLSSNSFPEHRICS
jgi:hypothetical protein